MAILLSSIVLQTCTLTSIASLYHTPPIHSWFDAQVSPCTGKKAKNMSKKKDEAWQLDDTSGSLLCLPNNEEFEAAVYSMSTTPYVYMQPVDDIKAGYKLLKNILMHRISIMLQANGFVLVGDRPDLEEIEDEYVSMKEELLRQKWPKTSDLSHFSRSKVRLFTRVLSSRVVFFSAVY